MKRLVLLSAFIIILFLCLSSTIAEKVPVDPSVGLKREMKVTDTIRTDSDSCVNDIYGFPSTKVNFPTKKEFYKDSKLDFSLEVDSKTIQDEINEDINKVFIVYKKYNASHIEIPANDSNDYYNRMPRFLGFAPDSGKVGNMKFPWDSWSGIPYPGDRDWIGYPANPVGKEKYKDYGLKILSSIVADNKFNCNMDTGKTNTPTPVDLNANMIIGVTYNHTVDASGRKNGNSGVFGPRVSNLGSDDVNRNSKNFDEIRNKETFELVPISTAIKGEYKEFADELSAAAGYLKWDAVVKKPKDYNWQEITYVAQPPTYLNWGMGLAWKADYYYMSVPIAPFFMVDQLNFGTQVVSCEKVNCSDGRYRYVVWVKYWVTDWEYNSDSLIPEMDFRISNGNGVIESKSSGGGNSTSLHGGVTLTESFLDIVNKKRIVKGDPLYINCKTESEKDKLDQGKCHAEEVGCNGYLHDDNKIRYGKCWPDTDNPQRLERYVRLVVRPEDPGTAVALRSAIGVDNGGNKMYIGEKNISDNISTYEIKGLPRRSSVSSDYKLDYDVLSSEFVHYVNEWNKSPETRSLTASITPPGPPAGTCYSFQNGWTGGSLTEGTLDRKLTDADKLAGGINYGGEYGSIRASDSTVVKRPVIRWTTEKDDFGFSRETGTFAGKGSFRYGSGYGANGQNPVGRFLLESFGSISRSGWRSYYTGADYHHESGCYDEEGNVICGHSAGDIIRYTGYRRDDGITRTGDFQEAEDSISIRSLSYNGSELPLQHIEPQLKVEKSGNGAIRGMEWEGDRYDIPVARYMRNLNENGSTRSLTKVPGNHGRPRTFQHVDSLDVRYAVAESFTEYFKPDREAAKGNYGNYKKYDFQRAPFSTDKQLTNTENPIKSGFFYVPYGEYKVRVRTVIYKKHGEKTEHESIVDSIIKSFSIKPSLPTMQYGSDGKIIEIVDLKGNINARFPMKVYKKGVSGYENSIRQCYPTSVLKDYKQVSNVKLQYNTGPGTVNDYLSAAEAKLLANTDELFRKMLEGWTYSKTADSWGSLSDPDAFKYREYVASSDIYRVEEETELTFTVNPVDSSLPDRMCNKNHRMKFYVTTSAKDGKYPIEITFDSFNNGRGSSSLTIKGAGSTDSISFTVVGSMYEQ